LQYASVAVVVHLDGRINAKLDRLINNGTVLACDAQSDILTRRISSESPRTSKTSVPCRLRACRFYVLGLDFLVRCGNLPFAEIKSVSAFDAGNHQVLDAYVREGAARLARSVWAEGAAEDVPYEEFFDVLRLHAGPLHRLFAEFDCRDIGESGAKAAERRPDAAGKVDFLEHCFIAKRVLIGSSYFTAGPKRSTSSFHEAMILAFVFRAL